MPSLHTIRLWFSTKLTQYQLLSWCMQDHHSRSDVESPPAVGSALQSAVCDGSGLSDAQVKEMRERHGPNEVQTKQVPEWRKIARRYLDFVSIIIVRLLTHQSRV